MRPTLNQIFAILVLVAIFGFGVQYNNQKQAKIDKIKPKEVTELKELITKEGLLRIFPSHLSGIGGTDGFFIARLKKVS